MVSYCILISAVLRCSYFFCVTTVDVLEPSVFRLPVNYYLNVLLSFVFTLDNQPPRIFVGQNMVSGDLSKFYIFVT